AILPIGRIKGSDIAQVKRLISALAAHRLPVDTASDERVLDEAEPVAWKFAGDSVGVIRPDELLGERLRRTGGELNFEFQKELELQRRFCNGPVNVRLLGALPKLV